jgi:hypothetical protein
VSLATGVGSIKTAPIPARHIPEEPDLEDGRRAPCREVRGVTKIAARRKPEQFVKPGVVGGVTALGVPAEQKSDALHVYADGLGAFGVGEPSDVKET